MQYFTTKNQRGGAMISFLFTIVSLGFYLFLLIKLLPVYINNYSIKNALQNVQSHPEVTMARNNITEAIHAHLQKVFMTDNITAIKAHEVDVIPNSDGADIKANYDARVNMTNNISIVIKFENTAKVRFSGEAL